MNFIYLLFTLLIVFCIDLTHADTESYVLQEWRTAKVSRTFESVSEDESTTEIVERIEVAFAERPIDEGYTELLLDRIFRDPATENLVFAFHVRYVDDIWAVFVVDDTGQISDNFVLSQWGMYED